MFPIRSRTPALKMLPALLPGACLSPITASPGPLERVSRDSPGPDEHQGHGRGLTAQPDLGYALIHSALLGVGS